MKQVVMTAVAALATAAPALAQDAGAAPAEEAAPEAAAPAPSLTRTVFDDWTRVCDARGACVMEQIGKTPSGDDALLFRVRKLPEPQTVNGERVEALAQLRTPLNVALSDLLRLQVDSGQVATSPFSSCDPTGCNVQAPLLDEQLASFRRGVTARFAYTLLLDEGPRELVIDISLLGFTRAYNSL